MSNDPPTTPVYGVERAKYLAMANEHFMTRDRDAALFGMLEAIWHDLGAMKVAEEYVVQRFDRAVRTQGNSIQRIDLNVASVPERFRRLEQAIEHQRQAVDLLRNHLTEQVALLRSEMESEHAARVTLAGQLATLRNTVAHARELGETSGQAVINVNVELRARLEELNKTLEAQDRRLFELSGRLDGFGIDIARAVRTAPVR